MTHIIGGLFAAHSIASFCYYAECHILFIIMLNVIMLSVVMLSVVAPFRSRGKLADCDNEVRNRTG
jgi:hypothetical protein